MCPYHWLCETGSHGWCYFQIDENSMRAADVTDEDWEAMDTLYEQLRQRRDRGIASELGKRIAFALKYAAAVNRPLGQQRRDELAQRYAAAPDPQAPPLRWRVYVRGVDSPADAAAEIRKLGDDYAAALGEALRIP